MVAVLLLSGFMLKAQDNSKIKFGAYARALNQTSTLGKEDTTHVDKIGTGHVLLDLGLHITPDKKTEIVAIVRFKSDLNGFYGAGTSATLRQMYVRGIIGKAFNYQVGDLYLEMTPFTFYNNSAEGTVNEATIFRDIRRDYTNYENLSNRGTAWWQQGFYGNFALGYKDSWMDTIRFDAFCLRNRTSNFISVPTSMQAGGKVTFTQSPKLKFALNYVNLFEIPHTMSPTSAGYNMSANNQVASLELMYKIRETENSALSFSGEVGFSTLNFSGDTAATDKSDYFFTGGFKYKHKPSNLTFTAGYSYVGDEFFSSAAQTKRVNYALTPTLFPAYGNDPFNPYTRHINIFDLVRDPSIYNAGITRQLMSYDPTLANAQPYGKATPNRKGLNLGVRYADSANVIVVDVQGSLLSDVAGEGSSSLRNFTVLRTTIDFNVNNLIGFKRRLILTAGHRYENTNRGGDPLSAVKLNSNLVDFGLEMETLKKLDLLLGVKMLLAKGNEFIAVRNVYNDVTNYDQTNTSNINATSNLYAVGLKYRFTEKTYLTLQDHMFYYKDNNDSLNKYSINQVIILFNMNF